MVRSLRSDSIERRTRRKKRLELASRISQLAKEILSEIDSLKTKDSDSKWIIN